MTAYDRVFCNRVGIKPFKLQRPRILWDRVFGFALIFGVLSGAWILIVKIVFGVFALAEVVWRWV